MQTAVAGGQFHDLHLLGIEADIKESAIQLRQILSRQLLVGEYSEDCRSPRDQLSLPKKLPEPQTNLHRIHPRIRHGQPGIGNMHVPDINGPRAFPEKMEAE